MNIQARLEEIKRNGYEFDFGKAIGSGFNIFGKQPWFFIAYTILFIPVVFFLALSFFISPIIFLSLMVPFIFVYIPAFYMGHTVLSTNILEDKIPSSFSMTFHGFSKYLGVSIGLFIILALIGLLYALPIGIISGSIKQMLMTIELLKNQDFEGLKDMSSSNSVPVYWSIIEFILQTVLYTFTMFTGPIIVRHKLGLFKALQASFTIASKKFFLLALIQLLLIILVYISVIPCGLGLPIMVPVYFATNAGIYHMIIKDDEQTDDLKLFNEGLLDS